LCFCKRKKQIIKEQKDKGKMISLTLNQLKEYTDKFNYSSLIEEDYLIRTKIEEVFHFDRVLKKDFLQLN
jgi:uncharacterized metal-binding protein